MPGNLLDRQVIEVRGAVAGTNHLAVLLSGPARSNHKSAGHIVLHAAPKHAVVDAKAKDIL